MINRLISTLLLIIFADSAIAGPWLREKGSGFLSTAITGNYLFDTVSQNYLEYGLTDKTTVVADLGFVRPRFSDGGGYATLSFRRALSKPDATLKWAYELGVGVGWVGDQTFPNIRTAISTGRGLEFGEKSGWATAEAAVIWDLTGAEHIAKFDTTLGVNFTDLTTGMLQLYTAHIPGRSVATIAPSVVFNPKFTKFRFQIGAESEIGNHINSKLKLGLWREF